MTKRTKIHHKAIQSRLQAVELAKQRHVAFQWVTKGLQRNHLDKFLNDAISVVYSALVEKELDAYRNLFMMAIVFPDDLLENAKQEVMKRFIGENYSIMEYLDVDCQMPNMYLGADRDAFRELMLESLTNES